MFPFFWSFGEPGGIYDVGKSGYNSVEIKQILPLGSIRIWRREVGCLDISIFHISNLGNALLLHPVKSTNDLYYNHAISYPARYDALQPSSTAHLFLFPFVHSMQSGWGCYANRTSCYSPRSQGLATRYEHRKACEHLCIVNALVKQGGYCSRKTGRMNVWIKDDESTRRLSCPTNYETFRSSLLVYETLGAGLRQRDLSTDHSVASIINHISTGGVWCDTSKRYNSIYYYTTIQFQPYPIISN